MSMAEMLRDTLEIDTTEAKPLADIFDEEPPTLNQFISDAKYLNQVGVNLSTLQYDFIRHFEQILYPETYILMVEEFGEYWNPLRFVNEYAIEWGKGSGKDFCCQICFARVANILLCLKNPQQYFDFGPATYLHLLNVASSAPQAHGVFFKPLRKMLVDSAWFKTRFEGNHEPGPQAQEIRFVKQIELISGHSQASTLEGKNLVAGIADEISEFPTEDEVNMSKSGRVPAKTAKAIISMLRTSGSTRFPETYRLAQISFPRYKGDAIEQAIIEAKADIAEKPNSRFFASGPYATWEVNPRYDKYERVEIPGATQPVPDLPLFHDEYKKNPAESRAKYECKPELAENRFFNNDEAIFAAFPDVRPVPPITFEYYWGIDNEGDPAAVFGGNYRDEHQVPGWQVKFHFAPDFRPVAGALYAMHGDMAISGDRAGVAMSHVRTWDRRDWPSPGGHMVLEQRPVVKVDFCDAFTADATAVPAKREVQIRWYRKLIWELRSRGFHIGFVSFDNFQSADSMQILEAYGIETERASTDRDNRLYDTLRDVMYDNRLEGYYNEILISEIRRLSLLKNGRIDHPPGGSKDMADALAGSVAGAVQLGGDEGETVLFADEAGFDTIFASDSAPASNEMSLDASVFAPEPLGMDSNQGLGAILW